MANKKLKGLVLEIGGDTTKLVDSLKGPEKECSDLQSKLKSVNQMLKFDPTNTELLAQKQRLLKEQISSTEDKLKLLKETQRQFIADGGNVDSSQYIALQQEIQKTESNLKRLKSEQSGVSAELEAFGKKLEQTGDKIETMGKKVAPVSAAVGAGLTVATKNASDFEDGMAKMSTLFDTTQTSVKDLSEEFIKLSNETGKGATELAEAGYQALSASVPIQNVGKFVKTSAELAKVGFTDTSTAVDVLTTAINAYGLSANDADKIANNLVNTQNLGKTTVNELASSMGKIIPTASSMGVNLNNLCTVYAEMTKQGIATAEATTYANEMLNEIGDSGSTVAGILQQETGESFQQLMADGNSLGDVLQILKDYAERTGTNFNELWSSTSAGKAALAITNSGAEEFNNTLQTMATSTDVLGEGLDKLSTPSAKAKKAMNQLKNDAMELGQVILESIAPIIEQLAVQIEAFTNWFSALDPNIKQVIVVVLAMIAALGPVLIFVGKICKGISSIISLVGTIGPALSSLSSFLSPIISGIGSALSGLFGLIMANPVVAVIVGIVAVIAVLWAKCEWFRDGVTNLINQVRDLFVNGWNSFKQAWNDGIANLKNKIDTFFQNLGEGFSNSLNGLSTWIGNFIGGIKQWGSDLVQKGKNAVRGFVNSIGDKLGGLGDEALTWGSHMINGFISGIKSRIGSLISTVTSIPKKIRRLLHFTRPDEGPLRDYETWMPDMMDGLSQGIKANEYKVIDAMKNVASMMDVNAYSSANVTKALNSTNTTTINLNVVSELDGRQVAKSVAKSVTRSTSSRLAFQGV